jgi:D-lactate dehydrogenase (cytochrome)
MSDAAIGILTNLLGTERVITDGDACAARVADLVGQPAARPCAIIRPAHVDDVGRIVKILTDLGIAVVARGGGTSIAAAREPDRTPFAVLDMADLNAVTEINDADRYVTVEAGCTWGALRAALESHGLRPPVWAAPAAAGSTVGGAVSTNLAFAGTGAAATLADTVLSVDVVLADGSLVETGAAAGEGRSPFFRHFGPDFTGMFLGDCGAFGVKVRVTLPLVPVSPADGYIGFAFERFEDLAEAHVALAREHVAAEQWGIDPDGNAAMARLGFAFLETVTFHTDASTPERIAQINKQLVDGHRAALRGGYSLHVAVEGTSERDVDAKLGRIRRLLVPTALKELPGTLAQQLRTKTFPPLHGPRGPAGENWIPVHGLFPLSKAATIVAVTDEYFLRHREEMLRHGIAVIATTMVLGSAFVLTPMFTWPDGRAEKSEAAVMRLRRDLIGLWDAFGAVHLGLGRSYPYAGGLSSAARALADAIKRTVDPRGLMNPGVLQIGAPPPKVSRKFAEFPQNLLEEN